MIVKGGRRGGAKQLAAHLLRRDTNEYVFIHEIEGYPKQRFADQDLNAALSLMAAQGQAKGKLRTLYHSILAPQEGEVLNKKQLKHAVDTLAKNLGMEGHQRVVIEHHKEGRQHFHVVFNILHPETGKQARLQWTRKVEWNTSRQLEKELGLKPVAPKGRASKRWENERGKRSGIGPQQMRKEVTAIYHASKTGREFVANLDKAGYVLTKGDNGSYVLVDKAGDIHGLMRRIEGVKLKDLRQKFPDLKDIRLPSLADVLKERRPIPKNTINKKAGKFQRDTNYIGDRKSATKAVTSRALVKPIGSIRSGTFRPARPSGVAPLFITRASFPVRHRYQDITRAFRLFAIPMLRRKKRYKDDENKPLKLPFIPDSGSMSLAELIAWAWANGRFDILLQYGVINEIFEP